MGGWISGKWGVFILSLIISVTIFYPDWMKHGVALADQNAEEPSPLEEEGKASGEDEEYHTPLAGEPFNTTFMGRAVNIPALYRGHVTALTLGGGYSTPPNREMPT